MADVDTPDHTERRLLLVFVGLCVVQLAATLIMLPAQSMTVDEAKYLGIGTNVLAGNGPLTVFGTFFPYHSPLWPVVMVAPQQWFGVDAMDWAHVVTIASACATLVLVARLGWRISPPVGVMAAASLLTIAYFASLGRTHGLDMPAAALVLGYVVLGDAALRRSSIRLAAAAGLLFGVAFLVKELALPFAPVPFLAALVRGRPPADVARLAAVALLPATLSTSWWFIVFAQFTGEVYRLGTPAWTLVPLTAAGMVAVVAGWFAPRWMAALTKRTRWPAAWPTPGVVVGWLGTFMWTALLLAFLARTRTSVGLPFLDAASVSFYLRRWLPDMRMVILIGVVGSILAVGWRIAGRRGTTGSGDSPRPVERGFVDGVDDLIVASLCGLPLVLFVVSLGEIPRHYIAQIGIALALGSAGWLRLIEDVVLRSRRTALAFGSVFAVAAMAVLISTSGLSIAARLSIGGAVAAVGLAALATRDVRLGAWLARHRAALPLTLAGLFVAAGSIFSLYSVTARSTSVVDAAKADAVATVSAWVRASVPPGARVAFADRLAYETAARLQGSYDLVQQREFQDVRFDPDAPLGLARRGVTPSTDWVAVTSAPLSPNAFYGYQGTQLADALRSRDIDIWILTSSTGPDEASAIEAALEHATGARVLARWSWPYRPDRLQTTVFGIDPEGLRLDDAHMYITPDALDTLLRQLEAHPDRVRAVARALIERVVLVPEGASSEPLRARLRVLAGD
jgi:4-amino-4-deoxy-L-arabinose transferase-like glycosyltransferase